MNTPLVQLLFTIAGFFLLWGGTAVTLIRRKTLKDAEITAALVKVSNDINNLGEKLNHTDRSCISHTESIAQLRIEQQSSRDDRSTIREKVASNFTAINALREDIQADRIAVMATLHSNERAASERDATTREQLARISERLNIEQMVNMVVRNLRTP